MLSSSPAEGFEGKVGLFQRTENFGALQQTHGKFALGLHGLVFPATLAVPIVFESFSTVILWL